MRVDLQRTFGDYGFEATTEDGHVVMFDSSLEHGGLGKGIRPMQSMLPALGTCSAIDIVHILKKQKQVVVDMRIVIEGKREEGKVPSLWKTIHVQFYLQGIIEPEKAEKACELSIEKYCSVAETLRRAGASITWESIVETNIF
jgi:putative redox protein